MKKTVIFCGKNTQRDKMLADTFSMENRSCELYYLQDVAFVERGYCSIYEYYLKRHEDAKQVEQDLYYAFIETPPFWEVQAKDGDGVVIYQGKIKAMIYFRYPYEKRLVQRVEWLSETGVVYKIDYYNRYGWVYCTAFANDEGDIISKSYYNSKRQELINVNVGNGRVLTYENGQVSKIYHTIEDFEKDMMKAIAAEASLVIITEEKKARFVSEWASTRGIKFIVCAQESGALDECTYKEVSANYSYTRILMSSSSTVNFPIHMMSDLQRLPYSRLDYPEKREGGDVFVLTASDKIHGLEPLVEALPTMRFHIAARSMMSPTLMNMADKDNVYLYPLIREESIEKLLERCEYYLDTNEMAEVDDIVTRAAYAGLLIISMEGHVHNRDYVPEECLFASGEDERIIALLTELLQNPDLRKEMLLLQQQQIRRAMAIMME